MREFPKANGEVPAGAGTAGLDALFAGLDCGNAPGLVVGVARHGEVLYRRGFGLASVELAVPNSPRTRMRIGSTSKHFTCLAALLLAEEGKLALDAGVRGYLPELPELPGHDVQPTLRQLMQHTGGYRCHLDAGFLADGMAIKPAGQALAAHLRQRQVNCAPGERFIYNNTGYHLLSIAIARASGMAFEAFLAERIFAPLGMMDTASVPSDFELQRGMATLHVAQPDGAWKRGIFPSLEIRGEGGMISSVDDLLRWLAHLRGPKRVGSDASWAEMLTPARLANGYQIPYALGLMRHDYRGVEVLHHAGGVVGGACQMLTVPAHALDIVIMANGAPAKLLDLSRRVVDIVLGEPLLAPPSRGELASADHQALLGRHYHSRATGFSASFVDVDGVLALQILNQPAQPLHRWGDLARTRFEDTASGPFDVDLAARAGHDAAPPTLRVSEGGNADDLALLPAMPPAAAAAGRELVGRYHAPDLDADACVQFEGDVLRLRLRGRFGSTSVALEALADDVFAWQMDGLDLPMRGMLGVLRRDGRVRALRIDTMRTRQLLLEREEEADAS